MQGCLKPVRVKEKKVAAQARSSKWPHSCFGWLVHVAPLPLLHCAVESTKSAEWINTINPAWELRLAAEDPPPAPPEESPGLQLQTEASLASVDGGRTGLDLFTAELEASGRTEITLRLHHLVMIMIAQGGFLGGDPAGKLHSSLPYSHMDLCVCVCVWGGLFPSSWALLNDASSVASCSHCCQTSSPSHHSSSLHASHYYLHLSSCVNTSDILFLWWGLLIPNLAADHCSASAFFFSIFLEICMFDSPQLMALWSLSLTVVLRFFW